MHGKTTGKKQQMFSSALKLGAVVTLILSSKTCGCVLGTSSTSSPSKTQQDASCDIHHSCSVDDGGRQDRKVSRSNPASSVHQNDTITVADQSKEISHEYDRSYLGVEEVEMSDATNRRRKRHTKRKAPRRIPIRFTPNAFQARDICHQKAMTTFSRLSSTKTSPRGHFGSSLVYYAPIVLERSLLLFGLSAIAVMKFDSQWAVARIKETYLAGSSISPKSEMKPRRASAKAATATTSLLGRITNIGDVVSLLGSSLSQFILSLSFEWQALFLKVNDVLPSLTGALLIVWVPQLISSRAWWDLGTLFGMPMLLSMPLSLTPSSGATGLAALTFWVRQKLLPSMTKMIHKVIWAEAWKLVWEYVFRPIPPPTCRENDGNTVADDDIDYNDERRNLEATVTDSTSESWMKDWYQAAISTSSYLWNRIESKMKKMTSSLLQKPFEQQMKLSIIGV